ncbi:hypothetical protein EOL73_00095 [Candidatus Saccharibacteria bacterium]|nr:hypothetical protein [Candidatus Saccharibacteria bacterium]
MKYIHTISATLAIFFLASLQSFAIGNIKSDEVFARSFGSPSQATLEKALTAIGSAEKTLVVDGGEWEITDDVTVPENITLDVRRGSMLDIDDDITVTINGEIDAGRWQIFDGNIGYSNYDSSGVSVTNVLMYLFDVHQNSNISYPEWFGATTTEYSEWGDASTSVAEITTAAINSAIASARIIKLSSSSYGIIEPIRVGTKKTIIGERAASADGVSSIFAVDGYNSIDALITQAACEQYENLYIKDLMIYPRGLSSGITCTSVQECGGVSGVSVIGAIRYGIGIIGGVYCGNYSIEECNVLGASSIPNLLSHTAVVPVDNFVGIVDSGGSDIVERNTINLTCTNMYSGGIYSIEDIADSIPDRLELPTKGIVGVLFSGGSHSVDTVHTEGCDIGVFDASIGCIVSHYSGHDRSQSHATQFPTCDILISTNKYIGTASESTVLLQVQGSSWLSPIPSYTNITIWNQFTDTKLLSTYVYGREDTIPYYVYKRDGGGADFSEFSFDNRVPNSLPTMVFRGDVTADNLYSPSLGSDNGYMANAAPTLYNLDYNVNRIALKVTVKPKAEFCYGLLYAADIYCAGRVEGTNTFSTFGKISIVDGKSVSGVSNRRYVHFDPENQSSGITNQWLYYVEDSSYSNNVFYMCPASPNGITPSLFYGKTGLRIHELFNEIEIADCSIELITDYTGITWTNKLPFPLQ